MEMPQQVIGLDVSKATLAVCQQVGTHLQHLEVANTPAGFRQLVRCGGATSLYVLEATGPYYLALAYHLVAAGAQVAVLNPLVVKRFIQMHLGKGKSDRKDAQWLLRYGQQQVTPRWQPDEAVLVECRQLEQASELLIRQKTMVHNALEALQAQPIVSPVVLKQLRQTLKQLTKQVEQLESKLLATVEQRYPAEMGSCAPFRASDAKRRPCYCSSRVGSPALRIIASSLPRPVCAPASSARARVYAAKHASQKWVGP